MYSNGINLNNTVKEEILKPKLDSSNFNFDGESFSDLMEKEESPNVLRETAQELAEDESVLSTDEENRAMIKRNQNPTEFQKVVPIGQEDKTRLLRLMDISNKVNLNSINITKSKKELENNIGPVIDDNDEPEDITSIVAKMMATREDETELEADVESSLDLEKHLKDYQDERDRSQVLHETEEELKEDESILSTEEENLAIARRNMEAQRLKDEDYKTTEEDMIFLDEIVALNNQAGIEAPNNKQNTKNIVTALINQTRSVSSSHNKIDISELSAADVDCIIGMLRKGVQTSSNFTDENNDQLNNLSRKFLALLKDSIVNNKIFRIDFDKDISVIIKINKDGALNVELQTTDEKLSQHIKENLYLLKEKFESLNVKYERISLKEKKD